MQIYIFLFKLATLFLKKCFPLYKKDLFLQFNTIICTFAHGNKHTTLWDLVHIGQEKTTRLTS